MFSGSVAELYAQGSCCVAHDFGHKLGFVSPFPSGRFTGRFLHLLLLAFLTCLYFRSSAGAATPTLITAAYFWMPNCLGRLLIILMLLHGFTKA